MFAYSAYNLGISSELAIPEFTPSGSGGDVHIRIGNTIDSIPGEIRVDKQKAIIDVQNTGRFVIRNGEEIIAYPYINGDSDLLRRFIIGVIFGVTLYQRGNLVLHASSVQTSKGAIAFIGNAGMGKSTMAMALVARGYKFVTDDVCAMEIKNGVYNIIPSYPFAKVSQEVAENILQEPDALRFETKYEDKLEYRLYDVASNPVPLTRVYLLNNQWDSNHQTIESQKAVLEIIKNSLPTRFGHPGDQAHFFHCVELVRTIPIFNLKRANSISNLSETIRMIEEHLEIDPGSSV